MPKKDRHNDGTEEYNAEAIHVLGGREAVRRRPGMYIGSTDQRGLHHLVYEIVYNSVDEAMAGFCTHIKVTIEKDNSITVASKIIGNFLYGIATKMPETTFIHTKFLID